jgi:hypothetical protein
LATKKKPADAGEVDLQTTLLERLMDVLLHDLGFSHRQNVDASALGRRACKPVADTVPRTVRRETGGAGFGKSLQQGMVYVRDVGLKGNHRTLNRRGTTGDGNAGPPAFRCPVRDFYP